MIAALIQIIHLLWLSVLEFFPSTEFFIYPYLKSLGWLPYTQIIDHHFPGLMMGPITFFNLGFSTPEGFKALFLLIIFTQSFLIYKISKSKLAVLLYAIWQPFFGGNVLWYDLFLPLFTLPAYLFLNKKKYFWSGIFLGLGLVWKQSLLPLILILGIYLLIKKNIKAFWSLVLGVSLPVILMLIYLMGLNIFNDFWFWNVIFNVSTYRELASTLITKTELLKISVPIMTMIFFGEPILLGWGILSIMGGLSRFGLEHLQPLIPFAVMAVASQLKTKNKKLTTFLVLINLLWAVVWEVKAGNFGMTRYFDKETYQLVDIIKSKSNPGDEIFLIGVQPIVYSLTKTVPPRHYFSYQLPWIMKVNEDKLLESWKQGNVKIAVRNVANTKNVSLKLVQYLESNYSQTDKIGDYLIYESRN